MGQVDLTPPRSNQAQTDVIEAVHEATQGHVARMNTLFRCMRALREGNEPVSAELVRYAVRFTAGLTRLASVHLADRMWEWEPEVQHHLVVPPLPKASEPRIPRSTPRPQAPSRERIAHLREERARAESVRREQTHVRPSRRWTNDDR